MRLESLQTRFINCIFFQNRPVPLTVNYQWRSTINTIRTLPVIWPETTPIATKLALVMMVRIFRNFTQKLLLQCFCVCQKCLEHSPNTIYHLYKVRTITQPCNVGVIIGVINVYMPLWSVWADACCVEYASQFFFSGLCQIYIVLILTYVSSLLYLLLIAVMNWTWDFTPVTSVSAL